MSAVYDGLATDADTEAALDFRRKGCTCRRCKGDQCDPNASHGSGAPIVKHPTTGKDTTYRRPSSMGKPLEDTYHLDLWSKRTVLVGAASSPAIIAKVANLDPKKDKAALDALAEEAIAAGKGTEAADLGTALHKAIERINLGELTIDTVPELFKADVEAYLAELDRHGLSVTPGMVEQRVVNDVVRAAGTFDVILEGNGSRYTSDLKTGKQVALAQVGIAVQLATYRNGLAYDVTTDERSPLPSTNDTIALVIHLPYGSATCTIIDVDIKKGWQAAQLAATAKSWNYRKDLFTDRVVGVESLLGRSVTHDFSPRGWTPPDEGEILDREVAREKLAKAAADRGLDEAQVTALNEWVAEGDANERPWRISELSSRRRFTIYRGAVRLLESAWHDGDMDDDFARAVLTVVLNDEVQPAVAVGTALGSMSTDDAQRLIDVCDALARGDELTSRRVTAALAA